MRELTGRQTEEVPEYSPLDVERINTFRQTRIGMLITTPQSSLAQSAKEKLRPKLYAIFDECRNAR